MAHKYSLPPSRFPPPPPLSSPSHSISLLSLSLSLSLTLSLSRPAPLGVCSEKLSPFGGCSDIFLRRLPQIHAFLLSTTTFALAETRPAHSRLQVYDSGNARPSSYPPLRPRRVLRRAPARGIPVNLDSAKSSA